MIIIIIALLLAHLSLTAFVPGKPGKAWLLWPFTTESKPAFFRPVKAFGLPPQGGAVTALLAGVAGICFVGTILALLNWLIPASWVPALPLIGSLASILLFVLYLSRWSILPIALNLIVIAFSILLNTGLFDS